MATVKMDMRYRVPGRVRASLISSADPTLSLAISWSTASGDEIAEGRILLVEEDGGTSAALSHSHEPRVTDDLASRRYRSDITTARAPVVQDRLLARPISLQPGRVRTNPSDLEPRVLSRL